MSDRRDSDDGEISEDSLKDRHTGSDRSVKSSKDMESAMRSKILSRLSRKKVENRESGDEDDDVRFSIQPKKYDERDRSKKEKSYREDRHEKHRDKSKSDRSGKSKYDGKHSKRYDNDSNDELKDRKRSREKSYERDRHRKQDEKREEIKKIRYASSDDGHMSDRDRHSKHSRSSKEKLLSPAKPTSINYRKEEVIEIQDVEMSPVELLEEKPEKEITSFTLDTDAGPKKYSKFESESESESDQDDNGNDGAKHYLQNSPSRSEDNSDVEEIAEDVEDEEDEENVDKEFENAKWEDLTDEQKEKLLPETRKKLEDAYQKQLISRLPVFYPGIMGCRNINEYECVNRVDEGTFGVVYRGKDKRTDEIVALKRLKMEKEKEGFPITALREINMLLKAGNHPNIVNVKEILIGSNMNNIYMAMEFVEHDLKSLIDVMVRRNKRFSTGEQKTLLRQLLSGINHMHKLWILHRDLKTSNLLMSHTGVLKIADFGLAREYGDPLKKFTSVVVTLWYRSPELLLGTRYYSTPVDMWSVGCIMAEFILLKPLFPGRGEIEQIKKIFMELGTPTEKIWPGVVALDGWKNLSFENYPYNQLRKRFLSGRLLNDTGFKLLMRLLTYDPDNRITAEEALEHDWFTENPLPVPPEEFPTFPAKSEQHKAPPPVQKKKAEVPKANIDPETAKLLKQLEVKPEHFAKAGGFSLKFDPTRF